MNYTEKYHLPQWELTDRIQMADFNAMCANIEKGIKRVETNVSSAQQQAARVVFGSYSGSGSHGQDNPTSIDFTTSLGRPPLLLIFPRSERPVVLLKGDTDWHLFTDEENSRIHFTWEGNKVSWYNTYANAYQLNDSGVTYYYLAIG